MDNRYTYLLVDAATVFFPLLLSFDKKVAYYKQWKHLLKGMLITGAFFIIWDIYFTKIGVWSFNEQYVAGLHLSVLPVEEWLFFVVVPFSCAFIYECLLRYFPFKGRRDKGRPVFLFVGILLTITGLLFWGKAYTMFSFCFCGLALLLLYIFKARTGSFRADAFLISYGISIIPFFIVNGILTALPVVIYNNAENTGVRLFTIPFEDIFYGMLLMLGNISIMEWSRRP